MWIMIVMRYKESEERETDREERRNTAIYSRWNQTNRRTETEINTK